MILSLSIVTYKDGVFEIIFRDKKTGEELSFNGTQRLTDKQLEFINNIAPACVWTDYQRITPEDD